MNIVKRPAIRSNPIVDQEPTNPIDTAMDGKRNEPSDIVLPSFTYVLTLQGVCRFKITQFVQTSPVLQASLKHLVEQQMEASETELVELDAKLRGVGTQLVAILSQLPPPIVSQLRRMIQSSSAGHLADLFASMLDIKHADKVQVLETFALKHRLVLVTSLMERQIQTLQISQTIQSNVVSSIDKKQRELLLREKLEAIKKELGESENADDTEMQEFEARLLSLKLPTVDAEKQVKRELRRLKQMTPNMTEYQIIRTYLDLVADLPWTTSSTEQLDTHHANTVLNRDHEGLDRVKQRIVEYIAVRKLRKGNASTRSPILCLCGPPGVGKTSLGQSIANAMQRQFHRISLGGVHDEAEIRGHRRTYIGSMPGMIIQGIKRCGVNNPVFLLDEIDKLGRDVRGDPASALLEVLDPAQNNTFLDHYLNIPFDLSNVLFIATANSLETIPAALLDRMEVIEVAGYTFQEKLRIAAKYLIPKQIDSSGLEKVKIEFPDHVVMKIATCYTREAGVRNLDREIGAVCRALAVEYSELSEKGRSSLFNGVVDLNVVHRVLGVERFDEEEVGGTASGLVYPGVVTGLAWTSTGAGGLLFIEATQSVGKGNLHLTGKLGDVIKESALIGITWVRVNASRLGITSPGKNVFENMDIHIHFPAGAIPKDGPR